MSSIGKKLGYFRKRAKKTQVQLEIGIGSASGFLSRIEMDKINPTRETILKIAKFLELNTLEIDYLVGDLINPATFEEINKAKKLMDQYFKSPGILAYMIDDRWRLLKVSDYFLSLLNIDEYAKRKAVGKSMISIIVDDSLGINKFLSKEHYSELLLHQLTRFYYEVGFMIYDEFYHEAVTSIRKNPEANKIWRDIHRGKAREFLTSETRKVYFKIGPFSIPLQYTRETLHKYPRFELVEYIPTNFFFKMLAKL